MGTLGDTAIYNFEKTQGALNDGFWGLLVGLEWRKGMMECTFTFTLAVISRAAWVTRIWLIAALEFRRIGGRALLEL
jgi:hypothetical protein